MPSFLIGVMGDGKEPVMGSKLVTLKFEPGKVVSWDEFIATHPKYSIALDGYVHGITRFDAKGPWLNLNHHEDCVRSATRCTCKQVLNAVRTGLFESFRRCGRPHATVWCNDPDEDVALATYLLCHPGHADRKRLKDIVELEDLLDTVNGFFPVKKRWHLLKMMIWFLRPYAEARESGALEKMGGEEMAALMDRIHKRIALTIYGRGREEEPDTRYEILEQHEKKFVVIREIGRYARYDIARQGFQSFLTVADLPGGRLRCTLARQSQFIAWMPVLGIAEELNALEGVNRIRKDRLSRAWGGSDLAIGSPRKGGTKIPLEKVVGVIVDNIRKAETRSCASHAR